MIVPNKYPYLRNKEGIIQCTYTTSQMFLVDFEGAIRTLLLTVFLLASLSCESPSSTDKRKVVSIELNHDSLMVFVDSTAKFTAVGKDGSGDEVNGLVFTWESAHPGIATIDNAGVVTGVAPGITTVTAKLHEVESLPARVKVIETGSVIDFDGNRYLTVKIGDQWWMAENLKVTHYRNGDIIPNVTDDAEWSELTTGAYCEYGNNPANVETYGRLYNWYALADSLNIAPEGWHVPSVDEWQQLEMYLGMSQSEADQIDGYRGSNQGSQLAADESLWIDGELENNAAFGSSGFTALPGGFRYNDGLFHSKGYLAQFWSSTELGWLLFYHRSLKYNRTGVGSGGYHKQFGLSVRLVRD